ncbi:DUF2946 family protein [Methyloligella sp. 2.7D]|uniref:DUF2946 family protein n=1 Tax=unclassified Methyloligella TaxID=2625955 RepID=UPI00157DAC15|nr:DUF2946 family protein [Methyloligella sp. GL2]QKP78529.1 DUF2946 family protein [Methyloligella sp. GL2]
MKRLRAMRQRPVVLSMIATLVFYTCLLAWQVPAMALARLLAPELAAQTIVLCTSSGPRVVAVDQDGQPIENSHLPDPGKSCPVCQGVAGAVTPLLPDAPALEGPKVWIALHFDAETATSQGRRPFIRKGHDPPFSS